MSLDVHGEKTGDGRRQVESELTSSVETVEVDGETVGSRLSFDRLLTENILTLSRGGRDCWVRAEAAGTLNSGRRRRRRHWTVVRAWTADDFLTQSRGGQEALSGVH